MYLPLLHKGICFLALISLFAISPAPLPTDVEALKPGVVKIRNNSTGQEGSGFVVAIDTEKKIAYIVTAAHVIEDDSHPSVTFFTRPDRPVSAASIFSQEARREGKDRGLSLLWVNRNIPADAKALPLNTSALPAGGDKVFVLGSPRLLASWSVIPGSITGLEGADIIFSADINVGVSGGPVTKDNQTIIGLVTATGTKNVAIPATQIKDFLKGVPGPPIPFLEGPLPSANRVKCVNGDSAGCLSYYKEITSECDSKPGVKYKSCMSRAECWRARGFALSEADDTCDEKRYSYNPVTCIQNKTRAEQLSPKWCDAQEN
jgi:Trypsin-like peptidase domain